MLATSAMGRFFALAHRPNRLSSASWIVESKSGSTSFLPGMSVRDVDFSRDGAWITYVSIPERALWRSNLDGYWGDFGEWSGLTADDAPLLTLNASSQEVYALDWDHY